MTGMRQVWRALPRPNPTKCACCMVFGRVFAHISSTFEFPRLVHSVKCGCYWQLICYNNALAG